jgi:uncharacterized protein YkwD
LNVRLTAIGVGGAVALAFLALLMFLPTARGAQAAANCSGGAPAIDSEERALLGLINGYRAQNGLGSLSLNSTLSQAAAWMTNDLATNGYFSHTDSLGRSPYRRAIDCGYAAGAGENLGGGTGLESAQSVFEAWKASPGHNANILGAFFHEIGIARHHAAESAYTWYWAIELGTQEGSVATPARTKTATPVPTTAVPIASPQSTRTGTPLATMTPAPRQPAATTTPSPPPTGTPSAPRGTSTPTTTATAIRTLIPPRPTATVTPPSALPLYQGANLVTWVGLDQGTKEAFESYTESVSIVYAYDPASRSWKRYAPGLPSYVSNLQRVEEGRAYWVITSRSASLNFSR